MNSRNPCWTVERERLKIDNTEIEGGRSKRGEGGQTERESGEKKGRLK